MPFVFNVVEGWSESLDREVIQYLAHTGSLSCTCKAAKKTCLAMQTGRLCCPAQQFYHPESATLVYRRKHIKEDVIAKDMPRVILYDENDDDSVEENEEFFAPRDDDNYNERAYRWSCCGELMSCTGCMPVELASGSEDPNDAMARNQRQRDRNEYSHYYEDLEADWDDSIYGDASRHCDCGYVDGVYTYCCCVGYRR
eukprot:scaffold5479_cov199-Amphora_coffeaeformis.AAC.69